MISGSGMQNKILEALSAGLPVIASNIPRKPIELVFGKSQFILTAESQADWITILKSPIEFENEERASLIKKHYGTGAIKRYYENTFGKF